MTLKIDWSALQGDRLYVSQDRNGNVLWSKVPILPAGGTAPPFPSSDERALHADEMKMYAEDAATCREPWLLWQSKFVEGSTWSDLTSHPAWSESRAYRRRPLTAQPFVFPHLFMNKANKDFPFVVLLVSDSGLPVDCAVTWKACSLLPEVAVTPFEIMRKRDKLRLFSTSAEAVQYIADWWKLHEESKA